MPFRRPHRSPEPPENVRIIRADGTVIPLEMRYVGVVDGSHRWAPTTPPTTPPTIKPGDSIEADALPAKTSIMVGFEP